MPRKPKPWFWKARNEWFVTIGKERHRLGPDKAEAERKFHAIMASDPKPPKITDDSVAAVLDDFLTWTYENRAPKTYRGYLDFCQSFVAEYGTLPVSDLHTGHVTTWLNGQKTWNSTTKHNAITALQRGFNWAVKNRGLDENPIRGMDKPESKTRTTILQPEEFDGILALVTDKAFHDLLVVSCDSGARPQEVKQLEARHVELDKQRAVIPTGEAKKDITRVVYFPTERSMEIIRRLAGQRPEGPIFLNTKGNPWTAGAVKCRFANLQKKLGKRYRQYDFRHTFITRKLRAGVDSHIVASLAGHKNTKMIDEVYSHVADDHQFMLDAAQKGEDAAASKS